jgi:hypothetical protein
MTRRDVDQPYPAVAPAHGEKAAVGVVGVELDRARDPGDGRAHDGEGPGFEELQPPVGHRGGDKAARAERRGHRTGPFGENRAGRGVARHHP